MANKMKQVQMDQYGTPDVLQLIESVIPQPQPGEVVIKTEAIGVNYSDTLRRRNMYFQPTPIPYVPGTEAVGKIIEIGEGVGYPYTTGAMVLAILPSGGGYSEYVAAKAQYCVPLPPAIDAAAANRTFVQGSAAQLMVSDIAKDIQGKTVLINAAAGGVGSLLVQLAKLSGATVIATSSSDDKLKSAQLSGADATVNYSTPGWSNEVKKADNGKGVDIAFEMAGGDIYNESMVCLADGGQLIVYGVANGVQCHIHPEYFVDHNISQSGFNLAYYINYRTALWQKALGDVIGMVAAGKLKIKTDSRVALRDAAEAHRQIEARQTTGKVTLIP